MNSATSDVPQIEGRLFGGLEVRIDGRPLPPLRSRKEQWLLALLVLRYDRETSREWLAATLWPDNDQEQALFYLRKGLSNLRKALGPATTRLKSPTPRTVRLDLDGAIVDVIEFDKALQQARIAESDLQSSALYEAVEVYRGSLLPDCLEEWAVVERNQREQAYHAALESLAAISHEQGDSADAVRWLRLLVASDPYRESAYSALMRALSAAGDKAALRQIYGDLRTLLRAELNSAPSPETEAVYNELMFRASAPAVFAGPAADPPTGRHLPVPISDLIGRDAEINEVCDLMKTRRLVSLVGAGGIGKTRLAIAAAECALPRFGRGVWFVDLAPILDPELAIHATAKALGIVEEQRRPLSETLPDILKSQSLLLVLDNCEHLGDAPARVADLLLSTCPSVAIVATSRRALEITGEQIYRVPSLPVPPVESIHKEMDPHVLMEFESIQLFADRAGRVDKSFRLSRHNASAVVEICRSLDGIPLAIEMAAARIKSLSVGEIEARLADRFRLLTTGSRAALPRQQTLRATIDWSYDLLSEAEKALLCRLSVFSGGCTLESAERVCAGDPLEEQDILEMLASLADKSLAIAEETGSGTRYRLLETVRQYSLDRLRDKGQVDELRDRHLAYFLDLTGEAEPQLIGPDEQKWHDLLEVEHDNLRSALTWAIEGKADQDRALRLCGALHDFWLAREYYWEGAMWCRSSLERADQGAKSAAYAATLHCLGSLCENLGDYAAALKALQESLSIRQELGEWRGTTRTLNVLGILANDHGQYDSARRFHEESLSVRRQHGDQFGISQTLYNLGITALEQGEYDSARSFCEESYTIRRNMGWPRGYAMPLKSLGDIAFELGDYATARSHLNESLSIWREMSYQSGVAEILACLGDIALAEGDLAVSRSLLLESVSLSKELRQREHLVEALESLAGLVSSELDVLRAARLWGACEAFHEEMGRRAPFGATQRHNTMVASARATLGDDATFDLAWQEGRAMNLEEAIALAQT